MADRVMGRPAGEVYDATCVVGPAPDAATPAGH
jgi:hypothetical protein